MLTVEKMKRALEAQGKSSESYREAKRRYQNGEMSEDERIQFKARISAITAIWRKGFA